MKELKLINVRECNSKEISINYVDATPSLQIMKKNSRIE